MTEQRCVLYTPPRPFGGLIKWFRNSRWISPTTTCFRMPGVFDGVFASRATNRNLKEGPTGSCTRRGAFLRANPSFPGSIFSSGISIVRRCSSINETHSRGKIIARNELRLLRESEHAWHTSECIQLTILWLNVWPLRLSWMLGCASRMAPEFFPKEVCNCICRCQRLRTIENNDVTQLHWE